MSNPIQLMVNCIADELTNRLDLFNRFHFPSSIEISILSRYLLVTPEIQKNQCKMNEMKTTNVAIV